MARPLQQRFEKSVDRRGDHHLWTGAKRPGLGTGRMRIDGKEVPAHRIAWGSPTARSAMAGGSCPVPTNPAASVSNT